MSNISQPGSLPLATPLAGTEVVSVNSGPVWTSATTQQISAIAGGTTVRCGTQVDVTTSTTLVDITNLTETVAAGTYAIEVNLQGTAGASGGWKVAFALANSAALTSIQTTSKAYTASAVAVLYNTTATSGTSIVADTAAVIAATITGTMVVSTGGTFKLQFAQNVSDATTCSIYVGSTMKLTKIA